MHLKRLGRAREALARGRIWFRQRAELKYDEVWALSELLCARPDEALGRKVASERDRLRHDRPWGRLLDPAQPGVRLSAEMVEGKHGFIHHLAASIGFPTDRALALLREYTASKPRDYELTHQLLALVWWEDGGRSLPPDLRAARPGILRRIRRAQAQDGKFSDLFAERGMLLSSFGPEQCPGDLPQWTDTVLEEATPKGAWFDPRDRKGGTGPGVEPSSHTSVLSLAVVQAYVDCMDPADGVRGGFVPWRGLCGADGPWR